MGKLWTPQRPRHSLKPPGFRPLKPVLSSPIYQQRHPTRYRWRKPIIPLIRTLYRRLGTANIHVLTYLDHPEGFHRTLTSLDVWGGGGRNWPVGHSFGQAAFDLIWNYSGPPYIDWAIWERRIYIRAEGFVPRPFGTDPFTWHDDHDHETFMEPPRIARFGADLIVPVTEPRLEDGTPAQEVLEMYAAIRR
jgi:hypothetical protein